VGNVPIKNARAAASVFPAHPCAISAFTTFSCVSPSSCKVCLRAHPECIGGVRRRLRRLERDKEAERVLGPDEHAPQHGRASKGLHIHPRRHEAHFRRATRELVVLLERLAETLIVEVRLKVQMAGGSVK